MLYSYMHDVVYMLYSYMHVAIREVTCRLLQNARQWLFKCPVSFLIGSHYLA